LNDTGVLCGKCGRETYQVFKRDITVITMIPTDVCVRCARAIDGRLESGPRRKGQIHNLIAIAAKINELDLHGKTLTSEKIKHLFDYSPYTNLGDSLLNSRGFIKPIGDRYGADKWRFK